MSFYDEFLVPDFDPMERKTIAEYLALFKVAFDPHDTIIRNHKNANRIANNMVNVDGYSVEQMYSIVDEARAFHGLEKIERRPTQLAPDLGWVCGECKTHNADGVSLCGFCDTPRLSG